MAGGLFYACICELACNDVILICILILLEVVSTCLNFVHGVSG